MMLVSGIEDSLLKKKKDIEPNHNAMHQGIRCISCHQNQEEHLRHEIPSFLSDSVHFKPPREHCGHSRSWWCCLLSSRSHCHILDWWAYQITHLSVKPLYEERGELGVWFLWAPKVKGWHQQQRPSKGSSNLREYSEKVKPPGRSDHCWGPTC